MGRAPTVELFWWQGCPSWGEALAILREEMVRLGLDPDSIVVRQVRTDADADREGFVGSPTIRVDGRDVEPPGDQPNGLTCRVYRLGDGRISPLPAREHVHRALEAINGGDG